MLKKYLVVFIVFTVIYLFSFHFPIFNETKILFFRGLKLMTLVGVFMFLAIILANNKGYVENAWIWESALITAISLNLVFFVLFPVTIDRSVTTYLLENMTNSASETNKCNGLTVEEIKTNFNYNYLKEKKQIERRLLEQELTGFMTIRDGCVELTNRGVNFVLYAKMVSKLYGI